MTSSSSSSSSPLPPRLDILASNRNSHFGWLCTKTAYKLIPSEWLAKPVSEWPTEYPPAWCETMKKTLLKAEGILTTPIEEGMLTETILKSVVRVSVSNVRLLASQCSADARPQLATKEPLDIIAIIKKNVERKPNLNRAALMLALYPLYRLTNTDAVPRANLLAYTRFIQDISTYPDKKHTFQIHPADRLALFIHALAPAELDPDTRAQFVEAVLEACSSPDILAKYTEIMMQRLYTKVPTADTPPLQIFLSHLYRLSLNLGQRGSAQLFARIQKDISQYKRDDRSRYEAEQQRYLWTLSDGILLGAMPLFVGLPLYKDTCKTLAVLPLTTSHAQAIQKLKDTHFQGCPPGYAKTTATLFYKSWWFGRYLEGNALSLSERVGDWILHEMVVDEDNWDVGRDRMVQRARMRFRRQHPSLPFFNEQRADRCHFDLIEARRRASGN